MMYNGRSLTRSCRNAQKRCCRNGDHMEKSRKGLDLGGSILRTKGKTGAYCDSIYGVHLSLLNYQNNLDSAFTLAHEMGHAMHFYYWPRNNPSSTPARYLYREVASQSMNPAHGASPETVADCTRKSICSLHSKSFVGTLSGRRCLQSLKNDP